LCSNFVKGKFQRVRFSAKSNLHIGLVRRFSRQVSSLVRDD
jgi:hypothetical protein